MSRNAHSGSWGSRPAGPSGRAFGYERLWAHLARVTAGLGRRDPRFGFTCYLLDQAAGAWQRDDWERFTDVVKQIEWLLQAEGVS